MKRTVQTRSNKTTTTMNAAQDENKLLQQKPALKQSNLNVRKTTALGDITNIAAKKSSSAGNLAKKPQLSKPGVSQAPQQQNAAQAYRPKVFGQQQIQQVSQPQTGRGLVTAPQQQLKNVRPQSVPAPVQQPVFDDMEEDMDSDAMQVFEEEMESETAWDNIDSADVNDPQSVTEYVDDIYDYCREREAKNQIQPTYMTKQVDINEKMRSILVDWMLEVHLKFKLLPETMFLAVNIIDRFLEIKCVARDQLQLVGVTSMFIASKYEEIYPPECNDFVYISANAYTREQILSMEQCILNTLNFNLTTPTSLHFLRRFSKAAKSDYRIHTLCKFLTEMTLVDLKMLKYLPSQIAASAVYIARVMTKQAPVWNATLEHYTKYDTHQIQQCVADMNELLRKTQDPNATLTAVVRKYANKKFGEVAKIPYTSEMF